MGFFDRLANVWKGFLSLWVSDIENKNPEAVYEAAIEERVRKHRELKKAVSNIVYLRMKTEQELADKEAKLKDVNAKLPLAVENGDDEVALILIQQKNELTTSIEGLRAEQERTAKEAEEAKQGLVAFAGEIEKLKREKVEMLARKENAEARIKIQETLDGLSTDADIKALENVREDIKKKQAEANLGAELKGESLEGKLAKYSAMAGDATARSQLSEMKKQMAARKAASEVAAVAASSPDGGDLKKTM